MSMTASTLRMRAIDLIYRERNYRSDHEIISPGDGMNY